MRRAEQKQATRNRLVELAARRLREEGLAGNAVHRLMRDAGLTHGGFYVHFESKDALDVEALLHAVRERRRLDEGIPADTPLPERRKAVARRYLSRSHRDHPESGCAFGALLSEAAHGGEDFRKAFAEEFMKVVEARGPQGSAALRDENIALMALAMGGLALARAVPDAELSDTILRACRDASNTLADAFRDRKGETS